MQTVTSPDGTRIAFERGGDGPSLLLVHGTAADRTRWKVVRPHLEEHFSVAAMDRRGRGDSGDSPDYTIAREYEDIAAVVGALDPPVILFGHSHGAICALEAALRFDRLAGLILYEPPMFEGQAITAERLAQLEALLAGGDREGVLTTFMKEVVRLTPEAFQALRSSPAWAGRVAAAHTMPREIRAANDYRIAPARVGALSIPVLLLLGGASPPPFGMVIDRLADALPNARKVVMPGQHHNAMDTGPDLVVDAVVEFAREIG
jgi:pimeloyl-ACP methyl ester carboxylesterase